MLTRHILLIVLLASLGIAQEPLKTRPAAPVATPDKDTETDKIRPLL